jgi:hypothetical protein
MGCAEAIRIVHVSTHHVEYTVTTHVCLLDERAESLAQASERRHRALPR